jgi:hypothetical protein
MRAPSCSALAALLVAACRPAATGVEELAPPSVSGQSADPVVAVDPGTGDLLLSWVAGDSSGWHLFFARSGDAGVTWSAPVRVTDREHDVHPHGESSPRLVAAPGVVALAWTNSVTAPGRKWPGSNIRFSRSTDSGRTWSPALTLNDDSAAAPAGHIFHGAAWSGDSGLVVAWMDERGGAAPGNTAEEGHQGHHVETPEEPDATVYLASTGDLGRTWAPNLALWGAACPCCRVALARTPDGGVLAAWRKHFAGDVRDVVVTPLSTHSGGGLRVHEDNWVYPGCPHTGPGAAVDASGRRHVTWFNGKAGAVGVYYARAERGAAFGDPTALVTARTLPTAHPRVAALPDGGTVVAWDVGADGKAALFVARVSPDGRPGRPVRVADSDGADHPEVAALGDGRAVVTWTERRDGRSAMRLARITQ